MISQASRRARRYQPPARLADAGGLDTGLQQCLAADGDLGSVDAKKMEKLFLSLA